jgi:NAD(P)-dependent dehydrogenase (short-subunit alcohol dehydrogenase family)
VTSGDLVVVTGATRGFGRGVVIRLIADGYRVIAVGRARELLESLQAEVADPARLRGLVADLSSRQGVDAAIAELLRLTGGEAVGLVNNAAVQYFHAVDDFPLDRFEETLFVNTFVPFALSQALIPEMAAAGRGTIVNVASDLAYRPMVQGAAYVASKWGLSGMSQVFQEEVRERGIRVCVLEPGWIATGDSADARLRDGHMTPAELADAVSWVFSAPQQIRIDRLTVHPMVQGSWG